MFDWPEDAWQTAAGLYEASPSTQYSVSLFKALNLMIDANDMFRSGYGNGFCNTLETWCTVESWTTLLALYLGNIFLAVIIGVSSSIMAQADQASKAYAAAIDS